MSVSILLPGDRWAGAETRARELAYSRMVIESHAVVRLARLILADSRQREVQGGQAVMSASQFRELSTLVEQLSNTPHSDLIGRWIACQNLKELLQRPTDSGHGPQGMKAYGPTWNVSIGSGFIRSSVVSAPSGDAVRSTPLMALKRAVDAYCEELQRQIVESPESTRPSTGVLHL